MDSRHGNYSIVLLSLVSMFADFFINHFQVFTVSHFLMDRHGLFPPWLFMCVLTVKCGHLVNKKSTLNFEF